MERARHLLCIAQRYSLSLSSMPGYRLAPIWWRPWLIAGSFLLLAEACGEEISAPSLGPAGTEAAGGAVAIVLSPLRISSAPEAKGRPIAVRVVDQQGRGVAGIRIFWRVLDGGGSVYLEQEISGLDGLATAFWQLGQRVDQTQVLEVAARDIQPLRISGRRDLSGSTVVTPADSIVVDTIGALLGSAVMLELRSSTGQPVIGATVDLSVEKGFGRLDATSATTDSAGRIQVGWQLGDSLGPQQVVARIVGLGADAENAIRVPGAAVVDSTGGSVRFIFQALAISGRVHRLKIAADSVVLDALGATVLGSASGFDRLGNPADASSISWHSVNTLIADVSSAGLISAQGDGAVKVVAECNGASDTLRVVVDRVPAALRAEVAVDTVNRLGDTLHVHVNAFDRLGSPIEGIAPTIRNLTVSRALVVGASAVVPIAPGRVRLEVSAGTAVDTARVFVRQVAQSIVVTRAADTAQLDSLLPMPVEARDSNGFIMPLARLSVQSADTSIVRADSGGQLRAVYPGTASVTVSSGDVSSQFEVTVEGVAIKVDGVRRTTPRSLGLPQNIELTNGRFRLTWYPDVCEKAAFILHTRMAADWVLASHRCQGDWVYVASSVTQLPTSIDLVQVGAAGLQLRMGFGNHWFEPQAHGFPDSYQRQPYPFDRTVWLRPQETGYFTQVVIEQQLTPAYPDVEHEVGFGGVWGAASISTAELSLRTDTLPHTVNYNLGDGVDGAQFDRINDPLERVLIPLPGTAMITPVFPFGAGSVYVYRRGPTQSYGAYLYAAPAATAESARQICSRAWREAPFALPAVSGAQLSQCGPS